MAVSIIGILEVPTRDEAVVQLDCVHLPPSELDYTGVEEVRS